MIPSKVMDSIFYFCIIQESVGGLFLSTRHFRVLLLKTGGITKTIRYFLLERHLRRLRWQPGRF